MFIKGKKYCCREGGFLDGSEERDRKHRRERVIQKKRKEKKWNSYQDCFDLLVIDIIIVSTKVLRFFRFVVFLDFSVYIFQLELVPCFPQIPLFPCCFHPQACKLINYLITASLELIKWRVYEFGYCINYTEFMRCIEV